MITVVDAPIGCLGFDSFATFTAAEYVALRGLGFRFATHYLDNLTIAVRDEVLASGLMLNLVQTSRANGWEPTPELGKSDGIHAAQRAALLQIPPTDLWCDWEGPSIYATADDMSAYAREWCRAVSAGGHVAKVYVGAGLPAKLDATALYQLAFMGYWESQSDVSRVAVRGYQLHQLFKWPTGQHQVKDVFPEAPPLVANLLIDADFTGCDFKGGQPRMLKAA